jgi:hypothetical protein
MTAYRRIATAAVIAALTCPFCLPALAAPAGCPPGLAKKAVPCVPPGQVGKSWRPGDRVIGDYILIPRDQWDRYGLTPYDDASTYIRVDDDILRVMRDTLTVIEAIGIAGRVLN